MNPRPHWENVYETKAADDVSWFQPRPEISLRLIGTTGIGKEESIIDVGAGASLLVDCQLDAGFETLAMRDLSAAAIPVAHQRLGQRAAQMPRIEADVTEFRFHVQVDETPLTPWQTEQRFSYFHFQRRQ